jgi:hypothetical protein
MSWFTKHPKTRRNFFRKAQLLPYRAHRFQNQNFRQKTKLPAWPLIIVGASIGLIIALTSFFFTSPVFVISTVRVEGAATVNPIDIRNIAETYLSSSSWLVFKKNNRFLFDTKDLQKELAKKYTFSSLEIEREGHTLAIVFKEKVSSFLWLSNGVSYLLDDTGLVIRTTTSEETSAIMNPPILQGPTLDGTLIPEPVKILVFKDLADMPVLIGKTVLLENEVKNVRTFFDALQTAGIFIESFELNRSVGAWLKAVTRNGYSILFDPNSDVSKQADNTLLLLREQIKDVSVLEYIDVRFGDHVYYK